MATWLELRCENRDNPSAGLQKVAYRRCESHDNGGPMELAKDTRASILEPCVPSKIRHVKVAGNVRDTVGSVRIAPVNQRPSKNWPQHTLLRPRKSSI
jgi:hypothetical protein